MQKALKGYAEGSDEAIFAQWALNDVATAEIEGHNTYLEIEGRNRGTQYLFRVELSIVSPILSVPNFVIRLESANDSVSYYAEVTRASTQN